MKYRLLFALVGCLATFCSSAPATTSSLSPPPTSSSSNLKIFSGEGCAENQLYQTVFKSQVAAVTGDVRKLVQAVMTTPEQSGSTYEHLAYFVDKFGARFTGTENLEAAIDHMLSWLKKEGHENVHGENVSVPVWTRGTEWAKMVKPRVKKLNILGLGYSVGTPGKRPLEAPVIVVRDYAELERRAANVSGKIVVFNFRFESYGLSVDYREHGASWAAKYGGLAALIRSVTPFSINSPHTGMQEYVGNVTQVPAVSITVEDAELLQRLTDDGEEVVIRLYSENRLSQDQAISRNVVSELVGSQRPDEVVLVSGHLDSWDVGQGAMDDGAGAFVSWRALSVVKQLGFKPKRTMRSVLWTAEEMGLLGASAYAKRHRNETAKWSIALESDIGTFTPNGITFSGTNHTAQCVLHQILALMAPINATRLVLSNEGSDVTLFIKQGVPIGSLDTRNERYFWFHHTDGDTMAVESRDDLDRCTALWAGVAYALAAIDEQLPR